MAAPVIKIKRSSVPGKIPTIASLELGEFAINTYDGKVYIEQDQGGVGVGTTVIVVNPWSVGLGSNTYNTYFNSGNVGVGTTNPNVGVTSSNTAILAVGIVTAYKLYGDGSALTGVTASAIASVQISESSPASPSAGDLWYNSGIGRLFIYYTDDNSSQWVDTGLPLIMEVEMEMLLFPPRHHPHPQQELYGTTQTLVIYSFTMMMVIVLNGLMLLHLIVPLHLYSIFQLEIMGTYLHLILMLSIKT